MVNSVKRSAFQTAKITITAIMLCVFCWLFFTNPDSTTNTQLVLADTFVTSEANDDAAVSASPYSSASQFEHHKQSANWQFERIDETNSALPLLISICSPNLFLSIGF